MRHEDLTHSIRCVTDQIVHPILKPFQKLLRIFNRHLRIFRRSKSFSTVFQPAIFPFLSQNAKKNRIDAFVDQLSILNHFIFPFFVILGVCCFSSRLKNFYFNPPTNWASNYFPWLYYLCHTFYYRAKWKNVIIVLLLKLMWVLVCWRYQWSLSKHWVSGFICFSSLSCKEFLELPIIWRVVPI